MGWKGAVRSIQADMRRSAREQQRRQKLQAKLQALEDAADAVRAFEKYTRDITSTHASGPARSVNWKALAATLPPSEPQKLSQREISARHNHDTFKPKLRHKVFKLEEKKRKSLKQAITTAKDNDEKEYQNQLQSYKKANEDWKRLDSLAQRVLNNDLKSFIEAIGEFNPFTAIANLGTGVQFVMKDTGLLIAKVDVHGEDVIPKEKYTLRQSGTLSTRDMPKSEFYALYQDYVCSSVLRIGVELFALLPIDEVIINAQDDLLNPQTGHMEKQTILSAMLVRATLDKLNLASLDPSDAMKNFNHNMRFKKTAGFEIVKPLA